MKAFVLYALLGAGPWLVCWAVIPAEPPPPPPGPVAVPIRIVQPIVAPAEAVKTPPPQRVIEPAPPRKPRYDRFSRASEPHEYIPVEKVQPRNID